MKRSALISLGGLCLLAFAFFSSSCKEASQDTNYTLTVTNGPGVKGSPENATYSYSKGAILTYNYSLETGYTDLEVTLDGAPVPAKGSLTIDGDHALNVAATPTCFTHSLTVNLGPGTSGEPSVSGSYAQGTEVKYSYGLQAGYKDLSVTLDGAAIAASGSFCMNGDHTLNIAATPAGISYTLTVNLGPGTMGGPASTYSYKQGSEVKYSYSLQPGSSDLVVKLDGAVVPANGSITMNGDHTLSTSASGTLYFLKIELGPGTMGTPASSAYYSSYNNYYVDYEFGLQTGYTDLVVKLDGVPVYKVGTVHMQADHTLSVSATPWNHLLTIELGAGTQGSPAVSCYYCDNSFTDYRYSLLPSYKNLEVKLDGVTVPAVGTVPMRSDHTLSVSATLELHLLAIEIGPGTTGSPTTSKFYTVNNSVDFSYSLQSGYKDLVVMRDGVAVPAIGSVQMTSDHTLIVSATPDKHLLAVELGAGVTGSPTGSVYYTPNTCVDYSYRLLSGFKDLVVKLDGAVAPATGSAYMTRDHTLNVSATPE
jgi:hypothetical protein